MSYQAARGDEEDHGENRSKREFLGEKAKKYIGLPHLRMSLFKQRNNNCYTLLPKVK